MSIQQAMHNASKQVYSKVSGLKPGKSVFDLSYEKKLTCDMGQLIPIMCDEMVPGDHFKVGNQAIVRFLPLVAPIMHEVNMYVHYYFVPYRLMWTDWQNFITGGLDGQFVGTLPTWSPTNTAVGSLWDYMGFPSGISPTGAMPLDFPRIAYNFVYNEFYRDETLIPAVALTNETILNRCWEKDYFTASLPWQQRGTAPALPISGTTSAVWAVQPGLAWPTVDVNPNQTNLLARSTNFHPSDTFTKTVLEQGKVDLTSLNTNTVNLASATTFNVSDLRLAFQIQKFLERNARAGARYTEFLQAHFGVSPRDERLQRPEYVGGSKSPIIVSEVLQTSSTDGITPQGNMAGHGVTVSQAYCGSYHAQEFGLMIGLMSIMPRTNYQQGINRQWLRKTKYDFYFPEFANLSEQAILNCELLAKADSTYNNTIFGYQGRYDELRTKSNMITGQMRDTFNYWHLGRIFDPASPPSLNASFVTCIPSKRVFAAQTAPACMVQFGNLIKAFRPIPIASEPGLIDHH
nr:MAG: major capsid protein [Microviridae sp.]